MSEGVFTKAILRFANEDYSRVHLVLDKINKLTDWSMIHFTILLGVDSSHSSPPSFFFFSKTSCFPWGSDGFLERRIPGKNGEVSPRKLALLRLPVLGDVHACEDLGSLRDAWESLCQRLGGQVIQVQVDVVLRSQTSPANTSVFAQRKNTCEA